MVIIKTVSLLCQTEPPPFTTTSRTTNIGFLVRFADITPTAYASDRGKPEDGSRKELEQIIRPKVDLRILNYTRYLYKLRNETLSKFQCCLDGWPGKLFVSSRVTADP